MRLKLIAKFYGSLILGGFLSFYATVTHFYREIEACVEECRIQMYEDPFPELDSNLILYVRNYFIDPPSKIVEDPLTKKDYETPPWKDHGNWNDIMSLVKWIFSPITEEGVFIEIGAGVGDLLSLTSWMESELGWRGLLIEPNPSSYAHLRRRRASTSAHVCISPQRAQYQTDLWIPLITEDFEEPYKSIAQMGSRLSSFVDKEDFSQGKTIPTQCLTIDTVIEAARPYFLEESNFIHLLIIDTNGGETEIFQDLINYEIGVLVIRLLSSSDRNHAKTLVKDFNLTSFTSREHMESYGIYINKAIPLKLNYS